MTTMRPSLGLTANWIFDPPVSTPISRMIRSDGVAHDLIFFVGQCLRRRHGDRVAGMHAHRIEILDGADDHHVVLVVAHHFEFELFPAEHRFFDQHFMHRRELKPACTISLNSSGVVGDVAAAAAQRA